MFMLSAGLWILMHGMSVGRGREGRGGKEGQQQGGRAAEHIDERP